MSKLFKNNNKFIYEMFVVIIIVFLIPLLFLINIIVNGENKNNYLENRTNASFSDLKHTSLFDNSFQNVSEYILSDQFPMAEKLKHAYITVVNYNKPFRDVLYSFAGDNVRYEIDQEIFTMDNDNYLMWQEYGIELFWLNSDKLITYVNNEIKGADKFLYFINDSKTLLDGKGYCNEEYYDYLCEKLNNTKTSQFVINNISDYKYYYYKSDHHWNLYGSYEGYKNIIDLLCDDEQVIIPNEKQKIGDNFCGSFCRLIGYNDSKEPFYIYDYNFSNMNTYINGKETNYGHEDDYLHKGWVLNDNENYYGAVYGGNFGEILFDTNNNEKDNLLIMTFSFVNPISKLIASHFNKTYIIDIRYYKDDIGKEFDINDYIREKNIDKVLIMGDIDTLVTMDRWAREKQ